MEITERLQEAMDRLNDEQREAVEHLDGPLLVIAGPGTGKTQLLSLRAANILLKRQVRPGNILCLTFSDAGVDAMRGRLVELIGRDGYEIEVSTFHSFAESIRTEHPELFSRPSTARVASDLQRKRTMNAVLDAVSPDDPVYSGSRDGGHAYLDDMLGFVSGRKKAHLSHELLKAIGDQNLLAIDHFSRNGLELAASPSLRATTEKKQDIAETFFERVDKAFESIPDDLLHPVFGGDGLYIPFASLFYDFVMEARLNEESDCEAFKKVRGQFFEGTSGDMRFKDRALSRKMLSAMVKSKRYEARMTELGLFDFDDMVEDAVAALEADPSLGAELRERYRYIQLDEFQDTNPSQMRLVDLIVGEPRSEANVMAVGDDDQAIMSFQGASVEEVNRFVDGYHPATIVLRTNYRAVPALVEMTNRVAKGIGNRLEASVKGKELVSSKADDGLGHFERRFYESQEAERFILAEELAEKTKDWSGADHESIAVLTRRHRELEEMLPYLDHFDVPYTYVRTSNVFRMESMQTLLAVMRLVAALSKGDMRSAEAELPQIVASDELGIRPASVVGFALRAKRNHKGRWFEAIDDFKNRRLSRLKKRLYEWAGKAPSTPVRELVAEIYKPIRSHYVKKEDWHSLAEIDSGLKAIFETVSDEVAVAVRDRRAYRLADFTDTLREMEAFGLAINAPMALGDPSGVRLMTAHASKGLEFDIVYLLDSDGDTWYPRGGHGTKLTPSNVSISETKDENDTHRLVFVAISRAKDQLVAVRGRGQMVKDLEAEGDKEAEDRSVAGDGSKAVTDERISEVHRATWSDHYTIFTDEDRDLYREAHPVEHITATLLNKFCTYDEKDPDKASFVMKDILGLPVAPVLATEFGSNVHRFLQAYMNALKKHADAEALTQIVSDWEQTVREMDYSEETVVGLVDRFSRIVATFLPMLEKLANRKIKTEYEIKTITDSGVPIKGYIDLILIDEEKHEITIVDYKTGLRDVIKPTQEYMRQLLFYKLLLGFSSDYGNYEVTSAMNLYVEPSRGARTVARKPVITPISDEGQDELIALIDAVWARVETGDFDMSGFEPTA